MSDGPISSDHPLTEAQRRKVDALLNLIIPPDSDAGMPGAGDLGLLDPGRADAALLEAATAMLRAIDTLEDEVGALDSLPREGIDAALGKVAATDAAAFQLFATQALIFYYRDDAVLKALGLEPGPPFPRGNTIDAGDLSLLDPVRKRTGLYRDPG